MKILVTGGLGFMGSAFIRLLAKENAASVVVNYDLKTYAANEKNLTDLENNTNIPNYSLVQGDICDNELLEKTVKEFEIDTIVNFAAETHVDNSIENPEVFVRTNVLGTNNLLNVAQNHQIRFHQVSTDEVFGELGLGTNEKFNEATKYDPRSPYSASKAGADHLVMAFYNTYQAPVTISNSSNNYGPFQHLEKLIPLFTTNLLQNKKVPVYGDGKNVRDWLFVEDHARAILRILKDGKPGERYCLGGNTEKSNLEITRLLLELTGKDESYIEFVEDRKGHDRRYAVDTAKMQTELGWTPEKNFEEGLAETVDWYKKLLAN